MFTASDLEALGSVGLLEVAESVTRPKKRRYARRSAVTRKRQKILQQLCNGITAEAYPTNRFKYCYDVISQSTASTVATRNVKYWAEAHLFENSPTTNPTRSAPSEGNQYTKYLLDKCLLRCEFTNQCKYSVMVDCHILVPKHTTKTYSTIYDMLSASIADGGLGTLGIDAYAQISNSPLVMRYFEVKRIESRVVPPGDSTMFSVSNVYGRNLMGSTVSSIDYATVGQLGRYIPDRNIIMLIGYTGQLVMNAQLIAGGEFAENFGGFHCRVRAYLEYKYKILSDGGSLNTDYSVAYDTTTAGVARSVGSNLSAVYAMD